jgi:lactoylglutathione lyase
MAIDPVHHRACRGRDAKQTRERYGRMPNLDVVLTLAADLAPSTKAPDPNVHVVRDAAGEPASP